MTTPSGSTGAKAGGGGGPERNRPGSRPDGDDPGHLGEQMARLRQDMRSFVEKRIELLALDLTEPFSLIVAKVLQLTVGVIITLVGVVLALVAAAFALSERFDSHLAGFLTVGLPVAVIGVILSARNPRWLLGLIQGAFMNSILQNMDSHSGKPADPPSGGAVSPRERPSGEAS